MFGMVACVGIPIVRVCFHLVDWSGGKWICTLWRDGYSMLQGSGPFTGGNYCTFTDGRFFSHRRNGVTWATGCLHLVEIKQAVDACFCPVDFSGIWVTGNNWSCKTNNKGPSEGRLSDMISSFCWLADYPK